MTLWLGGKGAMNEKLVTISAAETMLGNARRKQRGFSPLVTCRPIDLKNDLWLAAVRLGGEIRPRQIALYRRQTLTGSSLTERISCTQQLFVPVCVPLDMSPNCQVVLRPVLAGALFAPLFLQGCGGGSKATTPSTTAPPVASSNCTTAPVTITHTSAANNPQLVVLDKAKYPKAVCNDGTSGAYVLRSGAGAAANRWILSLQGGGECFDQATCATRSSTMPTLVSTASYQANPSTAFGQGGLLGTTPANNPDFYDASVVQVLYCSSDDWSGNKVGTTYNPVDPTTWNWQGRAILDAVIADLTASHGLSSATEVMLTGQSAGGVGVFANANPVAKLIPSGARYVAYSDAAFPDGGQDYAATGSAPNYTSSATPDQTAKRILGLPLWNGTGDPSCSAAAASDPASQIPCYSGQTLLAPSTGTITLPMLVSVSEEDTNQLGTAGFPASATTGGALTASQAGYLSYFASSMRTDCRLDQPERQLVCAGHLCPCRGDRPPPTTTLRRHFPAARSACNNRSVRGTRRPALSKEI